MINNFDAFLLLEGLIKVPSSLLKSLVNHIYGEYLSYMYTFEKYKVEAETLSKKYNVVINKKFTPINKDVELNVVMDDVANNIKKSWKLEFGYLRLIIDWEQKTWSNKPKVNASYEESNEHGIPGYFTINPKNLIDLLNDDYDIKKLENIFEKVKTSMWHEASHAVQHNALKWIDKRQVSKERVFRDNPDSSKEDKRKEYLSSVVEFDPQIKTKIFQFRNKYGSDKENIRHNLAIFVGAVKVDDKQGDEFFMALKNTDIKRWKKAVKLFYLNYELDVSDLLKTIPNSDVTK